MLAVGRVGTDNALRNRLRKSPAGAVFYDPSLPEDAAISTIYDCSGQGNNGINSDVGIYRLPSGLYVKGYNIGLVTTAHNTRLGTGDTIPTITGDLTIAFWFYLLRYVDSAMVSTRYGLTDFTKPWEFLMAGGSDARCCLFFGTGLGHLGSENTLITQLGVWHCLMGRISGVEMKQWLDGLNDRTDNFAGDRQSGTRAYIGASDAVSGRPFYGYMGLLTILKDVAWTDQQYAQWRALTMPFFPATRDYPDMLIIPSKLRLLLHGLPGYGSNIFDQSPASQYDSSYGNNGIILSGSWVHIKNGVYALDFAGGADVVYISQSASLNNIWTAANGSTVSCIIKPTNTSAFVFIDKYNATGARAGWCIRTQNFAGGFCKIGFMVESGVTDAGLWLTPAVVPINQRTQVTVTYKHVDHTSLPVICLNGVAQVLTVDDPLVSDAIADDSAIDMGIGNRVATRNVGFIGEVSEVKIYNNQTLSEAEDLADYNNAVAFGIV